jgi:hypothetical protein
VLIHIYHEAKGPGGLGRDGSAPSGRRPAAYRSGDDERKAGYDLLARRRSSIFLRMSFAASLESL